LTTKSWPTGTTKVALTTKSWATGTTKSWATVTTTNNVATARLCGTESGLEIDVMGQRWVFSVLVIDEVDFGVGLRGCRDVHDLVFLVGLLVEDVHDVVLLWGWHDPGVLTALVFGGPDEDKVSVDLGVGDIRLGAVLYGQLWYIVHEDPSVYPRDDAPSKVVDFTRTTRDRGKAIPGRGRAIQATCGSGRCGCNQRQQ